MELCRTEHLIWHTDVRAVIHISVIFFSLNVASKTQGTCGSFTKRFLTHVDNLRYRLIH
jgi:hypothetical protein